MTAPTITRETETLTRAGLVLDRTDAWLEANQSGCALPVRAVQECLRDFLDVYRRLLLPPGHPDYLLPGDADLDVDGRRDNATEEAVERITEAIYAGTVTLIQVMAEQCGPDAERFVNEGGQQ